MRSTKRLAAGLSAALLGASLVAVGAAAPAAAVAPSGGCWVYSPTTPANIEDTVPLSQTSSTLAPWANPGPADYTLTSSGGTLSGSTRNFTLTFNEGPTNGGPAASGTVYYYFSVNGTNLPPVTKAFSAGGGLPIPGDTINGSFTIGAPGATTIRLRKVYYDIPLFSTRVACNGQTSGVRIAPSGGVNPATTPIDTNITNSFTATGPSIAVTGITNQTVNTHARAGDVISFSAANFSSAPTSVQLCNTSGASCEGSGTSTTSSGSITVPAGPSVGQRQVRVSNGTESATIPIVILDVPTIQTNVTGGGANTVVNVTGTNWDPNQAVSVGGYSGPNVQTTDPLVSPTPVANAQGELTTSFTVNASNTIAIGGSRVHAGGPPPTIIFASAPFTFSGDSCTAKFGLATTGTCSLLETVKLTVVAGDLKMSKVPGDVNLTGVTLDGSAQTSTGSLQDVTVKDYRGGTLGWSLVGKFSGLTGPGSFSIAPNALTWSPSCSPAANNNDTVSTGAAGAFVDAATAQPLCAVASPAGLGPDGTSGGDTAADAGLSLAVAANQASGNYVGTLTLTLS